ncbi:hypothetical protein [Lentibacillus sediminis]|uniref:hypothetical protein n=1 Tax=Lentibacillus sediminis TaxID=1940529 RepID=UPI000C1C1846|nr:hypothetical protein [Lentibacillus sediminis]
MMKRKSLLKFGAPVLALSLMTACGTGGDGGEDPAGNEAPMNQEDDNGADNPMEENGGGEGNGDGMNGGDQGNGEGGMNGGDQGNGEGNMNEEPGGMEEEDEAGQGNQ